LDTGGQEGHLQSTRNGSIKLGASGVVGGKSKQHLDTVGWRTGSSGGEMP